MAAIEVSPVLPSCEAAPSCRTGVLFLSPLAVLQAYRKMKEAKKNPQQIERIQPGGFGGVSRGEEGRRF